MSDFLKKIIIDINVFFSELKNGNFIEYGSIAVTGLSEDVPNQDVQIVINKFIFGIQNTIEQYRKSNEENNKEVVYESPENSLLDNNITENNLSLNKKDDNCDVTGPLNECSSIKSTQHIILDDNSEETNNVSLRNQIYTRDDKHLPNLQVCYDHNLETNNFNEINSNKGSSDISINKVDINSVDRQNDENNLQNISYDCIQSQDLHSLHEQQLNLSNTINNTSQEANECGFVPSTQISKYQTNNNFITNKPDSSNIHPTIKSNHENTLNDITEHQQNKELHNFEKQSVHNTVNQADEFDSSNIVSPCIQDNSIANWQNHSQVYGNGECLHKLETQVNLSNNQFVHHVPVAMINIGMPVVPSDGYVSSTVPESSNIQQLPVVLSSENYSKEEILENTTPVNTETLDLTKISLPVFCCKSCNIACLSLHNFNNHTCRNQEDKSKSSICNRVLIKNIVKLHQMRKFICEVCGLEYRNIKHISYHLPRCQIGPYPCNICCSVFQNKMELNYHKKKMHKGKKCFVCDECGKSFARRSSLRKHEVNWHESGNAVGPFKCDICPKKFIKRIYLTNHKLRMHSLVKKFLCQVCGNKFMTQNSLTTHMNLHSDTSRFVCSYCKKPFKRKDKLIYHERLHTGERPFSCELCGRSFVSKSKLNLHITKHKGERRHRCSHCVKTYAASWDLKQHIKKIHGLKVESNMKYVSKPTDSQEKNKQDDVKNKDVADLKDQQTQKAPSVIEPPPYMTVSTIPVVAAAGAHLTSIGQVMQVSGSSVSVDGVTDGLPSSSSSTIQPLGAPLHDYSVHSIQPQSFIFTQSYDVVGGNIQF